MPHDHSAVAEAIAQTQATLDSEHRHLGELVAQVARTREPPALAALLTDVAHKLTSHFEREEEPGGYYDAIGSASEYYRDQIRSLIEDHRRIITAVEETAARAAGREKCDSAELDLFAQELELWLQNHEEREHELGDAVLRAAAH